MADRFESCKNAVDEFNKKYGLSFSLDVFDIKASGPIGFGSDKALNELYRTTFAQQYAKVFGNCIDGIIDNQKVNPAKFFSDFEKVMVGYRRVCKNEGLPYPAANGGWTEHTQPLECAAQAIASIPNDKVEYAAQRYAAGELFIDDMKKYAETVNGMYSMIPREDRMQVMSTVRCYTDVLKKANESRPLIWKIIGFRKHFAERRAIKEFENYMNSIARFEGGSVAGENGVAAKLEEMRACLKGDDIEKTKSAVTDFVEKAGLVGSRTSAEKEKMSIREAVSDAPVKNAEKIEQIKTSSREKTHV